MSKVGQFISYLFLLIVFAVLGYGFMGWYDARSAAPELKQRAESLMNQGVGSHAIAFNRLKTLIRVQDPGFYTHSGIDLATPGAGMTTISQSLAKRLAFEDFKPGFRKIRQMGYALGLESKLSKQEILTLFLNTAILGKGEEGPVVGFENASKKYFGKAPYGLKGEEFTKLVAALIAPYQYSVDDNNDEQLQKRVDRINNLMTGQCYASGVMDVWYENCD